MIIGFVKGQQFKASQPVIVSETVNYLDARIIFQTAEWADLIKIAHFKGQDGTDHPFLLNGNTLPAEAELNLSAGKWTVFVSGQNADGTKKVTTTSATVTVIKYDGSPSLPEIGPDLADQILAKAVNAENVAQSVRDDADELLATAPAAQRAAQRAGEAADRAEKAAEGVQDVSQQVEQVRQGVEAAQTAQEAAEQAKEAAAKSATAAEQSKNETSGVIESAKTEADRAKSEADRAEKAANSSGKGVTQEQAKALDALFLVVTYAKPNISKEYSEFRKVFGLDGAIPPTPSGDIAQSGDTLFIKAGVIPVQAGDQLGFS